MFQQNKLLRFCVLSLLAIFLFVGVFAVRYYYFGSEKGDAPPSLKIGSALFKGQAVKGGLIEYSQEDKDNAAKADYSGKISVDVKKGTGYYFTEENMPLTDLLDAKKCMNPGVNRTLFFTYSPGGESGMGKAGFYIYPAGLASGDNSGITDPATFIVMKGRVFGLYSDNDVTAHCFKDAAKISSISASNIFGGTTFIDGWIQFAANKTKLSEVLDPIKTCAVSNVWVQDGLDSFKKQVTGDEMTSYIFDKYMLLWVKLKDCGKQANQPVTDLTESITAEASAEAGGGVKIDWTDSSNSSDNVFKYLIYRSTSSPVGAGTGNYVDDATSPGNLVGIKMAPATTFTDNKLLNPSTKYYYKIISRTQDNKEIGTSDEFEVTTLEATEIVIIDPNVILNKDIPWILVTDLTKSITAEASAEAGGGVKIDWTDSNNSAYKYLIYRSTSSPVGAGTGNYVDDATSPGNLVGIKMAPATTFTDNKLLNPDTKYYYKIISRTQDNKEIGTSDEFTVTTLANKIIMIDPDVIQNKDIWIVPEATEIKIIKTEVAEYSSTTMGTDVTVTYKITGSLNPEDKIYLGGNLESKTVAVGNDIKTDVEQTIILFSPYDDTETTKYGIIAEVWSGKDNNAAKAQTKTTVEIPKPVNYADLPCAPDEYNDTESFWVNCHPRIKSFTDTYIGKCDDPSWCPGNNEYKNNKFDCTSVVWGGSTCNIYTP